VIDAKTVDLLRLQTSPFSDFFFWRSEFPNISCSSLQVGMHLFLRFGGDSGIFEHRRSQEFGEWLTGYKL